MERDIYYAPRGLFMESILIHTCIPSTERLKQKDCHEFKASLAA